MHVSLFCNKLRILSESMKSLAFGVLFLGFLQSFVTSDYQVKALYEMRMQLYDGGGVLNEWKDNQTIPCFWPNVICQGNTVIDIILSDNLLSGEIPEQLLQVAQYNYTGNTLNCS
ncbi:unnamed protein product [Urochloa humidicola]